MTTEGILLAWLWPTSPDDVSFNSWLRSGGFLANIPGVSSYTALVASDDVEATKPHRHQISYIVKDILAITESVRSAALAAAPESLKSSEWHLYKQIAFDKAPGATVMPAGSTLVQVGMTPKDEPEIIANYHAWYDQEHLPLLSKVPGWKVGRWGEFVKVIGSENAEYAAPFVAIHRYEAENGLGGPEWQESVHTEWTKKVREGTARGNHRRIWRIESEVDV